MKHNLASLLILLLTLVPVSGSVAMRDSGFEAIPPGRLAPTGPTDGWQVQGTGRDAVKLRLVVACVENRARTGRKCLSLSIPADTRGFEFVTVGQRLRLDATKTYAASVWVRWPDGPDAPPVNANATSGHRSAIVSFWARHREGTGDFAGRDEWLFDNHWRRLTFRFRATDPAQRTLLYVSLLPNQKPADTTVLVDDFELTELADAAEAESRAGELVSDADFTKQSPGVITPPWYFANIGGTGIAGKVIGAGEPRFVTLAMDKTTSNFESAQLWQHLELRKGARYEVTCRMRWDNFSPTTPAPIVNYGLYHEDSRTWYGPVDQVLEPTGEWRDYRFVHVPPSAGKWKLYIQINGWGNFGNRVTISVANLSCRASLNPQTP